MLRQKAWAGSAKEDESPIRRLLIGDAGLVDSRHVVETNVVKDFGHKEKGELERTNIVHL